jgi:hypothetical protein
MSEAAATLVSHVGASPIKREDLVLLNTPRRTDTHVPVPHHRLVSLLEQRLERKGMTIRKSEFAASPDGMKLFGVLVLAHKTRDDFSFAIGLRTANDKSLSLQLIAGARVFVCDNMVFSGDAVVARRKHTSGLDIKVVISTAIENTMGRFAALDQRVEALKAAEISDDHAKALIVDAATSKGVMTARSIPDVVKFYFEPPHKEFEGRNEWSLHNAFTESFKAMRPNVAMAATIKLGQMFSM